jgi:hypothetical protein
MIGIKNSGAETCTGACNYILATCPLTVRLQRIVRSDYLSIAPPMTII